MDSSTEILPGKYTYSNPTIQDIDKWWNRIDYLAGTMYRPDKAWGGGYAELMPGSTCNSNHPLIRQTAHAVMGYIYAYQIYKNPIQKQKATDGLQWLLDKQIKTGSNVGAFTYYCSLIPNPTIWNGTPASDYETSLAGKALIYGYEEFKDARYLNSAKLAMEWDINQGGSWNHNTNMLVTEFLSEYYRTTKYQPALDRAIIISKNTIAKQNTAGYFDDIYNHNQIAYYHQMITRALIQAYSIMPDTHPDKPLIKKGMYKAINYIGSHQNADGSMWLTPTDPTPNNEEYVIDGLGLAYQNLSLPILNILNGLTKYYLSRPDIGKDATGIPSSGWKEPFEQKPLIAGYMVKFVRLLSNNNPPIGTTPPCIQ
jgi:hypothetical protein